MTKIELSIDKADELIAAMTRLAEALEIQGKTVQDEVVDQEESPVLPKETELPTNNENPVTLEQVRAVLTVKKDEGKNKAIKELLQKYGTSKLTAIEPAKYADLLHDAERL